MYDKEAIVKERDKIIALIDFHSENMKKCAFKSNLNPSAQRISHIFACNSATSIPDLNEVWVKFYNYCSTHIRNVYQTKSVMKRSMCVDFSAIMCDLICLSKDVVERVCVDRIDLLEDDEHLLNAELGDLTDSERKHFLAHSDRIRLKQSKVAVQLIGEEVVRLLAIKSKLLQKGTETAFKKTIRSKGFL